MLFDYRKLLGRITEMCGTQANFAKRINVSERSISLKLNNKLSFRQDEIEEICKELDIPQEQVGLYFFTKQVRDVEHFKTA